MTCLVYSLSLAYRIYSSDDADEVLFIPYERYIYLINLEQTLEKNNCLKSCNIQSTLMIAEPSRRDTHFLRFGRKQ
jgi:hypothetical protein